MTRPRLTTRYRLGAVVLATLMVTSLFATAAVAAPESETNDTLANADALVVGEATTGSLSDGSDVDLFTFSVQRGQQVIVQSSRGTALSGVHRIQVYEVVDGSFGFGSRKVDVIVGSGDTSRGGDTIERTGTYVAQVTGDAGAYSFTVDLSTPPDAEPNEVLADATPYTVGTPVSNPLGRGDVDLYTFDVTRGQSLSASASVPSAETNGARVQIYEVVDGSFGFGSRKVDLLPSPGDTSRGGDTVERTGTYVAQVTGGPADYSFRIDLTAPAADEPNEVLADATPFALNDSVTRELTRGDVDVYAFDLARGQEITATASVPSAETNGVRVRIYEVVDGSFGFGSRKVDLLPSPGDTSRGGDTVERTGTYVAQVTGGPANYTLAIDVRTLRNEPNDVLADATPYVPGTSESAALTTGDVDLYTFEAERGQQVNLSTSVASTETNDLRVRIYEVVDGSFGFGSRKVDLFTSPGESGVAGDTVERDGQYVIQLTGSPVNYTFAVTAARQEFTEPNDRTADATAFLPNPKAGAILGPGDQDYYTLTAEAGDTVLLNLSTAATRSGNVRAQAYEGSVSFSNRVADVQVSEGGAGGDSFQAATSGTYLVTVTGTRGAYALAATVDGAVIGVPNDRFESNENPTEADANGPLALGRYDDLRIVDADVDVFAVDLSTGDELNAGVDAGGPSDLSVSVVDASGTTLANGSATASGAEARYVVPSDGTYYVRVVGNGTDTTGYALTLRVPLSVVVSVSPARLSASPNETATAEVAVSAADLGVAGYAFDLAVDPAVATITDVELLNLGGAGDTSATVAPDGSGASVAVSNVSLSTGAVTPLVRVTLAAGTTDGESALTLTNASVEDGVGGPYAVSTLNGTVLVTTGPGNVGGGAPARDSDGDGLFEDVDGSGTFDFLDVIALLFSIDRIVGDGLGDFFDFNGRGGFDFLDVVELLFTALR